MIQMCNLGNWFAMIIQNDCNNSDNLGNWFAMIIQNDCKNSDKLVSQPVHFHPGDAPPRDLEVLGGLQRVR